MTFRSTLCSRDGSYLRDWEVCGVLDVPRLLVHLGERRVQTLLLGRALRILLWGSFFWRGASLRLTMHCGGKHLLKDRQECLVRAQKKWLKMKAMTHLAEYL